VIEVAGYRAVIEIARKPRAAAPAPVMEAPAQQALQLEGAVTASPATVLADLATSSVNLQQVETQAAAAAGTTEAGDSGRPRRRRRPSAKPADSGAASLMQVETSAAAVSAVEPAAPTAAPHPTRRRTRPQVSETQEPLVQVETQAK
jgi:ribonuclease E